MGTWLGRGLVRSRQQLSYQVAQNIMDGRVEGEGIHAQGADVAHDVKDPDERARMRESLLLLASLAATLRRRRLDAGALELASTELRFEASPDGALPTGST